MLFNATHCLDGWIKSPILLTTRKLELLIQFSTTVEPCHSEPESITKAQLFRIELLLHCYKNYLDLNCSMWSPWTELKVPRFTLEANFTAL